MIITEGAGALEELSTEPRRAPVGKAAPSPSVSVIIPTYGNSAELEECLHALRQQHYDGRVEIIAVDNSAQFNLGALSARWPEVTFAWEPMPGSYAARNAGLRLATGEVLAFTDADCRPEPHWIRAGIEALQQDGVALVGGHIAINLDAPSRPTTVQLFEAVTAFPQQSYVADGHFAATANMLTWRTVIDAVGPFNASLRSGGDAEFGRRVHAAGFQLRYAPEAIVMHPARASLREIFRKTRRTTAGMRDLEPDWQACLRYCKRSLTPPSTHLKLIAAAPRLNKAEKAKLAVLAYVVRLSTGYWRLRLQISGEESPRS